MWVYTSKYLSMRFVKKSCSSCFVISRYGRQLNPQLLFRGNYPSSRENSSDPSCVRVQRTFERSERRANQDLWEGWWEGWFWCTSTSLEGRDDNQDLARFSPSIVPVKNYLVTYYYYFVTSSVVLFLRWWRPYVSLNLVEYFVDYFVTLSRLQ